MKKKWQISRDWLIPLIYLIIGLAWILLSDSILFSLADRFDYDPAKTEFIAKTKGYFYVALTSVLLFILIKARTRSLVEAKNDFYRLFEEHPNAMWIYDQKTGAIMKANLAACRLYGYSPRAFEQISLTELWSESVENFEQFSAKHADGYMDGGEWLHKDKSGNQFYVHVYSHRTTYLDRDCRLVAAINVHEKVMAERERANIQMALDNSALVSIINPEGIFLDVNDQFSKISGYAKIELKGKSHDVLHSDYHTAEFWKGLCDTISNGKSWRGDIKNKARDGSFFWIDTVITPIKNNEGKVYRFIAISYNITEKKTISENRTALLNDLADYSFQTSHELRAPLARVMSLVDIFNEHPDKDFILINLRSSAEEMDDVIKNMNEILNRNAHQLVQSRGDRQNAE